jgi:hypothetical protein
LNNPKKPFKQALRLRCLLAQLSKTLYSFG